MTSRFTALIIMLAAVLSLSFACSGPGADSYYQNEQLANEARSFHYQLTYDQGSNRFVFDEHGFTARISIYPDRAYHFGLEIINHTGAPMTINWNGIEYVDLRGRPHSVIHSGVHYFTPVKQQTDSVIGDEAAYNDLLRPADREELDGALRLVPVKRPGGSADFGERVILVIPLKVLGEMRLYHFSLDVGAAMAAWPGDPDPLWY